jgi:DNA-binding transcriptional regulator GbsR (MarR family)
MESKNVSAQMKVLEQNGYIIKDDIPGRTNYYLIDERFFNIWLLMSEGTKKDGQRVLWLTKTLDMILDQDEIGNYAKNCFGKMKDVENKADSLAEKLGGVGVL